MAKASGRAVILRVLENHRGDPPEVTGPAIMAALKGHGLAILPDPAAAPAIAYCRGGCSGSKLRAGRCDVCGWTETAEDNE